MTGTEVIEMFENIIDDEPDAEFEVDLLNLAKDEIESEREWEYLKTIDTSITWATSDVYTTQHSLPSGFLTPISVYVAGRIHPWVAIPMEHRERFKDLYGRYFIDHLQAKIHFTGVTSQARTITLCYIKSTSDLTISTSWAFPSKFHKMLAFKMAELYQQGVDVDDLSARMGQKNFQQYLVLRRAMEQWDATLKMASMNYQSTQLGIDASSIPDVVTELAN